MRPSAPRAAVRHRPLLHCCPICATRHEVSEPRAAMGYGRQICCGPDCEGERRRRARGGPLRILVA